MPLPMVVDTVFRSEERFTQQEFFEWLQRRACVRRQSLRAHPRTHRREPAGGNGRTARSRSASRAGCSRSWRQHLDLGVVRGSSAGYDLPSGDTLEPDVSFMPKARYAAGPAPVRGRFLGIVPDLAVEILSKSTVMA